MDFSDTATRFDRYIALTSSSLKDIARLKAAKMEKYGMSVVHTDCLWHLYTAGSGGMTQRELSEREHVDRAQISRVLRELCREGYVARKEGAGTYKHPYVLTAAGSAVAGEINGIVLEINHFVSDEIPREDLILFYKTLETIARNLQRAVEHYT